MAIALGSTSMGDVIELNVPPTIPAIHRVRVLIVDDDRRVRQSLSGLIALRDGLDVVGTAGDREAALTLIRTTELDAVLLDLRLPELEDGFGLLADIHREWPAICIVAMSVQVSLRDAALAAGAVSFVPKGGHPESIGDAIANLDQFNDR
jgi:DNA-binding NarL/FixJ family response regulator